MMLDPNSFFGKAEAKLQNAALWLLGLFAALTYIFFIKEKNKDLVEENDTLKNKINLDKTQAAEEAAGKDADAAEKEFDDLAAKYKSEHKPDGTSGPAGHA